MVTDSTRPASPSSTRSPDRQRDRSRERIALCFDCGRSLAAESQRTERAGAHRHQRSNPGGYSFEFGCFSTVAGSVEPGPAVSEYTWFAGYAWRVSLCGGCGQHLGWRFNADGDEFYGLILARIRWVGGD